MERGNIHGARIAQAIHFPGYPEKGHPLGRGSSSKKRPVPIFFYRYISQRFFQTSLQSKIDSSLLFLLA